MPADTDSVLRKLEEREKTEGKLPPLLKLYQELLRVQAEVERKLASQSQAGSSREAIKQRLESGTPLVSFDDLALDEELLSDTFRQVIAIFADHYAGPAGSSLERLRELQSEYHLTRETVKSWFEKQKLPAKSLPRGVNKNIFHAIIGATLKPFLVSHARTLTGSIDQERWRRGYCPVCGGKPDLAFLTGDQGARWLKCSRCDTEWLFQRLQCPYCDNQNQNDLTYFTDDAGLYRLYICERCKSYIKAVDLRKNESLLLPLERLYTIDIDRQARERGYRPGYGL